MVGFLAHTQEAVGSNPPPATIDRIKPAARPDAAKDAAQMDAVKLQLVWLSVFAVEKKGDEE